MFKGYKNFLLYKDDTNKKVIAHPQIIKCSKCSKMNQIIISPAIQNMQICTYCRNPYYIIKP
jgi:hypothetical protein